MLTPRGLMNVVLGLSFAPIACLAQPTPEPKPPTTDEWQFEKLRLVDGSEYDGLLLSANKEHVEFVVISRKPGRPMYTVVMGLAQDRVDSVTRLEEPHRTELIKRYFRFKNRSRILLGRMEEVELTTKRIGGVDQQVYRGSWFTLRSTANEEMTRRCVVRIEQIFHAYRHLMPPTEHARTSGFGVQLYGSMDEYRSLLRRLELEIENPAFYSATRNIIVAGSDLADYASELARTRRRNEKIIAEYDELSRAFAAELFRVGAELKQQGFNSEQITKELALRKNAWEDGKKAVMKRITASENRNDAEFAALTAKMFKRIYHESFHAYLENFVFPHEEFSVPRWLNEGLAQVFESGQFEGDRLRVDAPRPDLLARLQKELRHGGSLPLAEILGAEDRQFLVTHAGESSERHYLYSWGLAYDLAFHHDLLNSKALAEYVSPEAQKLDPVRRFEKLVGMRLPEFERRWRANMLKLKVSSR